MLVKFFKPTDFDFSITDKLDLAYIEGIKHATDVMCEQINLFLKYAQPEDFIPSIKQVKFNPPATVVFWNDNTKTVVKAQDGEKFDQEKGLALAIVKKIYGNTGSYYEIFKEFCEDDSDPYTEFIDSHADVIVAYVNACFEKAKDTIKTRLIKEIRKYITPLPAHYKRELDKDSHDRSGTLVQDGTISPEITVKEFLKEYDGSKSAIDKTGRKWWFSTYEFKLHGFVFIVAVKIFHAAVRKFLENALGTKISDDDLELLSENGKLNEIFEKVSAYWSFLNGIPTDFVGISDMKLSEILESKD